MTRSFRYHKSYNKKSPNNTRRAYHKATHHRRVLCKFLARTNFAISQPAKSQLLFTPRGAFLGQQLLRNWADGQPKRNSAPDW